MKSNSILSFKIHLFRKRLNSQMAAVMLQVITSSYTGYSKHSLFNSGNSYQKHIVSKEYCFARDDE